MECQQGLGEGGAEREKATEKPEHIAAMGNPPGSFRGKAGATRHF